jgi:hypothetical protein
MDLKIEKKSRMKNKNHKQQRISPEWMQATFSVCTVYIYIYRVMPGWSNVLKIFGDLLWQYFSFLTIKQ